MGTQLTPLLVSKEISIEDLMNKKVAIDAYNTIYQYITSIRQRDGTPLMDMEGNVTSHLSGLFFRTVRLLKNRIKPAFVFDGKAPVLKEKERSRRRSLKEEAIKKYEKAVREEDIDSMRKYGSRTARITSEILQESKELIAALGLPIVQAPSEGEAQAAYMVNKGEFFGLISQDTDGLLFGTPRLIKNLSVSQKKKKKGSLSYESVLPHMVDLSENLNHLGIDIDQLIALAILVGTDFDIGGVKGIGPKKGLKLVKEYGKNLDGCFKHVEWDKYFDYPWTDVFYLIKNMPVTDEYDLVWHDIDEGAVYDIMVKKHGFNKNRIESSIEKLVKGQSQKGLNEWF